jgi:ABC-2 type transport system ATP-binding protein
MQTGEENLVMVGRLTHLSFRDARNRARELLERFDLAEVGGRRVGTYSGGMRRRLDLAVSLVRRPAVLFLDEPTTGLDVHGRQVIWRAVSDLKSLGVTILLTTQYLEEADLLADDIAIIDDGRVIAQGTSVELKRTVRGQRLDLTLSSSSDFEVVAFRLGNRIVRQDRVEMTIGAETDGTARGIRQLLDEVDPDQSLIKSFAVVEVSLDDVFVALTKRTNADVSPSAAVGNVHSAERGIEGSGKAQRQ